MHATLPWAWYVDPEILRREQELIFRSCWAYVGHTGQLERDGDWITAPIGLTPLVVVRDDGELRAGILAAYSSEARLRGNRLVDSPGGAAAITGSHLAR